MSMSDPAIAHRAVTRRDGQREGEPDPEPSASAATTKERAMKDSQRDLTSLSTAPHPDDPEPSSP